MKFCGKNQSKCRNMFVLVNYLPET